jgi:membrane associated rhomboid family serine protease
MPITVFALLVLSGAALYFMTPDERKRLALSAAAHVKTAVHLATHAPASGDPFDEFLHERTRWPIVTPLVIAVNVAVFIGMVFGTGAMDDAQTLIAWGANYAPRMGSGEWWRLGASTFVHAGFLHLVATLAGLLAVGVILECAVGRIAFAAVYFASGVVASVVSLWTIPSTSISCGASGALFGIFGLLAATAVCGCLREPRLPVSLNALTRIAAGTAVCVAYNLMTDRLGTPSELAGLCTGLAAGLLLTPGVAVQKPALRRAAGVVAATALIAIGGSVPLLGIIDARPELARIVAAEERTAGAYSAAVETFKRGTLSAKALARVIDATIIPVLTADRARLEALRGVPHDQALLVAAARRYFELRERSWRRRAEGLLKANMGMLREAEKLERSALEALEAARPLAKAQQAGVGNSSSSAIVAINVEREKGLARNARCPSGVVLVAIASL